jgi:hypothetical protein
MLSTRTLQLFWTMLLASAFLFFLIVTYSFAFRMGPEYVAAHPTEIQKSTTAVAIIATYHGGMLILLVQVFARRLGITLRAFREPAKVGEIG